MRAGAGAGRAPAPLPALRRVDRRDLVAVALLVLVPLVLLGLPALAGYPLLTGDAVIQNLPLRALAGALLRHGALATYDPYDFSGTPLLGGINAGAASPGVLAFAVLPPLAAYVLVEALAYGAAASGLYVFLRLRGLDPLAAALGGASFGLGGYLASQAVHVDVVETGAGLAFALVALERLADDRCRHVPALVALLAACLGGIGLAGSPEAAWYAALAAAVYAAHLLARPGRRLARAGRFAVGAALGGLVAAVQLLPGSAFVAVSQRSAGSVGFFTSGSLTPALLTVLVAPHLLGGGPLGLAAYVGRYNLAETDAYPGMLALAGTLGLAPGALRREGRPLRVWYAIGALGVAIALGSRTPLPHLLVHLPVVGLSRLPSRALLLFALAAAVLYAHFAQALLAPGGAGATARRLGALAPLVLLALLGATALGGTAVARALAGGPTGPWSVRAVAPYLATAGAVGLAALAFLLLGHRAGVRRRRALLVALALVDLVTFWANESSFAPTPARALGRANALERSLARLVGPEGRFVVDDPARAGGLALDELGAPDLNVLYRLHSAQGYGSLAWGPYARATGTHGQDVVSPAALAGRVADELDVRALLALPGSFEVPAGEGRPIPLAPSAATVRYFGRREDVVGVRLAWPRASRGTADGLAALARRTRLLTARGRLLAPLGPGTPGPGAAVSERFGGEAAVGLVLPPDRGRVRVVVETPRRAFSPSGALAAAVAPPHWRPGPPIGPYATFLDTRAIGHLAAVALGRSRPTAELSWHDLGARETVEARAAAAFLLVRSVADLPGWHAEVDGRPVRIRRFGLVQAVRLPAGRSSVTFLYTAPGSELGAALAGAGWAALVALAAGDWLATRRRRAGRGAARAGDRTGLWRGAGRGRDALGATAGSTWR
ncbi:MAG TPA: hypothetical protein VKV23_00410 [Acidimicrobiales bacterium]|nr:hypothetical protein [Acidimicrobiales bacterium]